MSQTDLLEPKVNGGFLSCDTGMNHSILMSIKGDLDISLLKELIGGISNRHESLISSQTKDQDADLLNQLVTNNSAAVIHEILVKENMKDVDPYVQGYFKKISTSVEIKHSLEATLLTIENRNAHYLILSIPSALGDQATLVNIYNELLDGLSRGYLENNEVFQFSQYASWRNSLLEEGDEAAEKFFDVDVENITKAPFQAVEVGNEIKKQSRKENILNKKLTKKISQYCTENNCTEEEFLLSCWMVLMYRLKRETNLTIGKVESLRSYEEFEKINGPISKVIPLAVKVSEEDNINDLIQFVQEYTEAARDFQDYYDNKRYSSESENDLVFPIGFNYWDLSDSAASVRDCDIKITKASSRPNRFVLDVLVVKYQNKMVVTIAGEEVNVAEDTIPFLSNSFNNLIENIVKGRTKISELCEVNSVERDLLLNVFNQEVEEQTSQLNIVERFESVVKKHPEKTAIKLGTETISYQSLNEQVNRIANYLTKICSVTIGDCVAIQMNRSINQVASILAVLKVGAHYLPVDSYLPAKRLEYILEDSGAKLLMHDIDATSPSTTTKCVSIEKEQIIVSLCKNTFDTPEFDIDNGCYIIYTSGSTGNPKGVRISHGNLANYLDWLVDAYDITEEDATIMLSSVAFDLGYTAFWSAITTGATLHLQKPNRFVDVEELVENLRSEKITYLKLTPSHFRLLVTDKGFEQSIQEFDLRLIFTGGEKIITESIRTYLELDNTCTIINHYGPTETTIGTVVKNITSTSLDTFEKFPVIGKVISNNKTYIVDESNSLVPIGAEGELCVAGNGLSEGYVNLEDLTKRSFIDNPFCEGEKLYKTGDLVKRLPNGDIDFIGRKDKQVKVNGFRVELGAIESVLINIEEIKQAVVLIQDVGASKQLTAFYTAANEVSEKEIKEQLSIRLPHYMVPLTYNHIDLIPLTPNGKVDKKTLLNGLTVEAENVTVADDTMSEKETLVADAWKQLFEKDTIALSDDFFRLGGDSIKAIQMTSRLREVGFQIHIYDIFEYPKLKDLVANISIAAEPSTVKKPREKKAVVTPIQKRFLETDLGNLNYFNQSVTLEGQFEPTMVQEICKALTDHHDALQSVFVREEGQWQQKIKSFNEFEVKVVETDETTSKEELDAIVNKLQASIDIENGPLIKVMLIKGTNSKDKLVMIIHHLIVDGVSWRIILEDLQTLLNQYKEGNELKLTRKTDSFLNWSNSLAEYAQSDTLKNELAYWKEIEKEQLTLGDNDQRALVGEVKSTDIAFTKGQTLDLLEKVGDAYHTEINDLLLAALADAFSQHFGSTKTLLALEGHGREEIIDSIDTTRTIGWFTSIFPIVLDAKNANDTEKLIVETKESLRQIPNKGVGYGILKYLAEEDLHTSPQISFNYLGQLSTTKTEGDYALSAEMYGENIDPNRKEFFSLSVTGIIRDQKLYFDFQYDDSLFDDDAISKLAATYKKSLLKVVAHCKTQEEQLLTPSDCLYKGLSFDVLKKLQNQYPVEDVYRLSPLQEGILFDVVREKDYDPYFRQVSYTVEGDLNVGHVESAFNMLLEQHDILRANFNRFDAEEPFQIISKEKKIEFIYFDFEGKPEQQDLLEEYKKEDEYAKFDLEQGALMRVTVIRMSENVYELIWSYHHIVLDGLCLPILTEEFLTFYNILLTGTKKEFPSPTRFKKYIEWLEQTNIDEAKDYWNDCIKGYSQVANLPEQRNAKFDKNETEDIGIQIDSEQTKAIIEFASNNGITLSTLLQTTWGILLGYYSDLSDTLFGRVISGRPPEIPNIDSMIGMFINTVPTRVQFDKQTSFVELSQQIQQQIIQGNDFSHIQLADILSTNPLGNNLFNHILDIRNFGTKDPDELLKNNDIGIKVFNESNFEPPSIYDLLITIVQTNEIYFQYTYKKSVYEREFIEDLGRRFAAVINQIVLNPTIKIEEIDFISTEEQKNLLAFNEEGDFRGLDKTYVDYFVEQAKKTPSNIAVKCGDEKLTYAQLDERTNQLANLLVARGVANNHTVGVLCERSIEMLVSIIGVLKAGGAFILLDPSHPVNRTAFILKQSNTYVLLSNYAAFNDWGAITEKLSAETAIESCIFFDDPTSEYNNGDASNDGSTISMFFKKDLLSASTAQPQVETHPRDRSYVCFTSGSTGLPKGAINENIGFLNHSFLMIDYLNINEKSVVAQTAPQSFDISIWQFTTALLTGASIVIYKQDVVLNPYDLMQQMKKDNVSIIQWVPSYLSLILEQTEQHPDEEFFDKVEFLLLGGETVKPKLVNQWFKHYPDTLLINNYGTAEVSDDTTINVISKEDELDNTVSIGKPMKNVSVYILDENMELCPVGKYGDIYVSGVAVGQGYIGNEELTAKSFIKDPFLNDGTRMYKTGDLGKWNFDGTLEFGGRRDYQVKVRGQRVELGEIEAFFCNQSEVKEAVVIDVVDENGDKFLVGFIVPDNSDQFDMAAFWQLIGDGLPGYMVPSVIHNIDQIPTTPNGKTDRKELLKLANKKDETVDEPENTTAVELTETEEALSTIWKEILGINTIQINDNFFDKGGHSLKGIRLISMVFQKLNIKLEIRDIFACPTIAQMAQKIDALKNIDATTSDDETIGSVTI